MWPALTWLMKLDAFYRKRFGRIHCAVTYTGTSLEITLRAIKLGCVVWTDTSLSHGKELFKSSFVLGAKAWKLPDSWVKVIICGQPRFLSRFYLYYKIQAIVFIWRSIRPMLPVGCSFWGDIYYGWESITAAGQSRKLGDHISAIHRKWEKEWRK